MKGLKDPVGRAAIDAKLALLRRGSLGSYREVGDGLIELKISSGPGYRVYIADDGRHALILLAGRKNTQNRDIKTAQRYWADYKARG
jgi:putative addiction module killer protein